MKRSCTCSARARRPSSDRRRLSRMDFYFHDTMIVIGPAPLIVFAGLVLALAAGIGVFVVRRR
jgi:hypothetical protein